MIRPVRLSSTGTPVARRRSNASAGSASGRACRVSRTAAVAAGAEADVPEKIAVRPPPAAVVVQPTPGASIERPGPDELAHGTTSGPDRASSHEGGPFQATEPEEAEYTIPTAATFERHAGQGRPDDLPSFPEAATAARPAARTAANVAAPAGSSVSQKPLCEESSARLRLTASMFQASRFDTAQSTAREDVGCPRVAASVASAEDLQDDEAGLRGDALRSRDDSGHLRPVAVAVGEIPVVVGEVPAGPARARRRLQVGMGEVDSAVHDRDAPALSRHAQAEQPVRADLRRSDLPRGPHEAVESDVNDVRARRESGDVGRRRPARDDGRVHEAARDGEAGALGARPERHDDRDPRLPGPHARFDLRRHDRRPRRERRKGECGGRRGSEERLNVHPEDTDHESPCATGVPEVIAAGKISPWRAFLNPWRSRAAWPSSPMHISARWNGMRRISCRRSRG